MGKPARQGPGGREWFSADKIPQDPDQRLLWLEWWAARRREELGDRDPLRERVRLRTATMLERQFHRVLDPLLDRHLRTYANTFAEEGGHWVSSPSPWYVVPRALRRIGASEDDVLVDFGCGTGRVVHQAAKRPLKRVIGVEIIPAVAARAERLVADQHRKYRSRSVEIVRGDVASFLVPDDLTIAYFGHVQYFTEDEMKAVLRNIIASMERCPRRVRLVFYPAQNYRPSVLATARFRLVPELCFGGVAIFESYP
jgi:SAM-dependent methyltransferase